MVLVADRGARTRQMAGTAQCGRSQRLHGEARAMRFDFFGACRVGDQDLCIGEREARIAVRPRRLLPAEPKACAGRGCRLHEYRPALYAIRKTRFGNKFVGIPPFI